MDVSVGNLPNTLMKFVAKSPSDFSLRLYSFDPLCFVSEAAVGAVRRLWAVREDARLEDEGGGTDDEAGAVE